MLDNASPQRLTNIDEVQDRFSQIKNNGVAIDQIVHLLIRDYAVDLDLLETVRVSNIQ